MKCGLCRCERPYLVWRGRRIYVCWVCDNGRFWPRANELVGG